MAALPTPAKAAISAVRGNNQERRAEGGEPTAKGSQWVTRPRSAWVAGWLSANMAGGRPARRAEIKGASAERRGSRWYLSEIGSLVRLLAEDLGDPARDAGRGAGRLLVAPHAVQQLRAHHAHEEHDQDAQEHDHPR